MGSAQAGLAGRRTTRWLIGILTVLIVVLCCEGAWLGMYHDEGQSRPANPGVVAAEHPVVMNRTDTVAGVNAAATAARRIVARDFRRYDQDVAQALELMTPAFAEQYQAITDERKAKFVAAGTRVRAEVVGKGVVQTSRTELDALVFVNQTEVTEAGDDGSPVPVRVMVTMVHTGQGWLVDDLQTQ